MKFNLSTIQALNFHIHKILITKHYAIANKIMQLNYILFRVLINKFVIYNSFKLMIYALNLLIL